MNTKPFTLCIFGDAQSILVQQICHFFTQKNIAVHLISFRYAQIPGVTLHVFASKKINPQGNNFHHIRHIFKIRKLIRTIKPNIVYAIYATSYGFMAACAGFRPYFVHAIGSDVLVSPQRNFLYKWILRLVFRKATHIFAISDQLVKKIQEYGINPSRIDLAILGANLNIFHSSTQEKIPFSIISTRNFEEIYRVEALIPALGILKQQYPALQVFIAGKGSRKKALEDLVKKYELENVVTFLGHLTPEQLSTYLQKSLVYVSLSASDGTSASLLEAMACGCIPVVTGIPANTPWIKHKHNGFLLNSTDSHEICDNILKAFSLPQEKIKEIHEFNYQLVANKGNIQKTMESIYEVFVNHLK